MLSYMNYLYKRDHVKLYELTIDDMVADSYIQLELCGIFYLNELPFMGVYIKQKTGPHKIIESVIFHNDNKWYVTTPLAIHPNVRQRCLDIISDYIDKVLED